MEGQVLCLGWTNEDRIARDHGYVGVLLCLLPMLPSRTHFYFMILYTFLSVDDRLVMILNLNFYIQKHKTLTVSLSNARAFCPYPLHARWSTLTYQHSCRPSNAADLPFPLP